MGDYFRSVLDEPDGPPEPVAQVRVLPGLAKICAAQKANSPYS